MEINGFEIRGLKFIDRFQFKEFSIDESNINNFSEYGVYHKDVEGRSVWDKDCKTIEEAISFIHSKTTDNKDSIYYKESPEDIRKNILLGKYW